MAFSAMAIYPVRRQARFSRSSTPLLAAFCVLSLTATACGDLVYLFPQNNRNNSIDIELTDSNTGTGTRLKLSDEEGFVPTETGYYQFSWPSLEQYGQTSEMAFIYFVPLVPGIQTLGGGQVMTPDGTWYLNGHSVDLEIKWEGSRSFPFVHKGKFLGDTVGGVTVEGDFSLSNMNCLADIFDYDSTYECGLSFSAGGTYDMTWTVRSDANWCPQSVVDAYLGTDREGSVSESKLELGDVKLSCVENYNNRVMCGKNPVEVEAEGCTWQVLGRGGPAGYDPSVVTGWFVVSAGSDCASGEAPRICETWLFGSQI